MWNIAKKFYGNGSKYTVIYNANKGVIGGNPNLIYPGQVIKAVCGGLGKDDFVYVVEAGDSLWKIAKEYLGSGWRYNDVMKQNGLKNATIHPGDLLVIRTGG